MVKFVTKYLSPNKVELIILIVSVLFVLAPISPINKQSISRDSGVFLYVGSRILDGDIPYIDVWDHKPPIIFFVNAFSLWLGRGTLWGVWIVEFIFLFCAVILGHHLIRKLFGIHVGVISLFLWLFSLFLTFAGGNLTQEYTLPFQFVSLAIFNKYIKTENFNRPSYLIGLLAGIIFFIRQNSIGISLAIVCYLILVRVFQKKIKKLFLELALILAGMLSIAVIFLIYFGFHHALYEFWDSAFLFNFIYVDERGWIDRVNAVIEGFRYLSQTGIIQLAILGWISGLFVTWKSRKNILSIEPIILLILLSFPIEIILVSTGGRPRIPYFTTLLPTLYILVALMLNVIFEQVSQRINKPERIFAIVTFGVFIILIILNVQRYINIVKDYRSADINNTVAEYVQKNTAKNDEVLLIGAETAINFLSQRKSPTRYVYQYPLFRVNYDGSMRLEEFYLDIIEHKPKLIIVTIGNGQIPKGFGDNKTPESEELALVLRAMYQKKQELFSWVVYEYVGETIK